MTPGKTCMWTVGINRGGLGLWCGDPGVAVVAVPAIRDGAAVTSGYEMTLCRRHVEAYANGEKQAIEPADQ